MGIRVGSSRCEHVINRLSIGINLPLFGGQVALGHRGAMTITTPSLVGAADLIMLKKDLVTHTIAQHGRLSGSSFSWPAAAFQ
jgi:hypothetical protein